MMRQDIRDAETVRRAKRDAVEYLMHSVSILLDDWLDDVKYDLGVAKPLVAVELDGHEFHERTKAQVASRNTRDADLQMAGWTVFHFSGSEVVRDPLTCAQRVFDFAGGQFSAFRRAVRVELRRRGIAD